MRQQIPSYFEDLDFIGNEKYQIKGSAGSGAWTSVPWAGIFIKDLYDGPVWQIGASKGYYIVYLFCEDMRGVYLSLNFGAKEFGEKYGKKYLPVAAKKFRKMLEDEFPKVNDYTQMDLGRNGFTVNTPAPEYEKGDVFSIFYSKEDLKNISEEKFLDDLKLFLRLYDFIYKKIEKTIFTDEEFEQAKESLTTRESDNDEGESKLATEKTFYQELKGQDLYYDKKTIENYLLSLKVKPFVILTGSSGTGKTKIAQKFAEYMWEREYVTIKTEYSKIETDEEKGDYFYLGKGTLAKLLDLSQYDGTADFYFDDIKSNEAINLDIRATCDDKNVLEHLKKIDNLSNVKIQILKRDLINTFFNENFETETFLSFEPNIGKNPEWCIPTDLLNNFLPIKNEECEWNAIIDGINTTITFWVHTVNFKLSSTNKELTKYIKQKGEKDKLKIDVDLDSFKSNDKKRYEGVKIEGSFLIPENYKIIPVGANWTDNRNIFGFYNVITKKYQTTPALDLILKTKETSEPRFLILDEMNLSHVERYFADFLSAIESKEPIPLYSENNVSEELDIPPNLPIPKNLFVIGTVNVDETTYMFSPKVLDRANVLEFESFSEDFSIADFMKIEESDNSQEQKFYLEKISYLEDPLKDSDVLKKPMNILNNKLSEINIKILEEDGREKTVPLWEGLSEQLESINEILKPSGFDLGFRAVKEILSFMYVAYIYENFDSDSEGWEFDWERYLDAQIKQKMLPKIHGSKKVLGNTLDELLIFCLKEDMFGEDKELPKVNEITKDNAVYYSSAKKIAEMREVLENQRYVSFIN